MLRRSPKPEQQPDFESRSYGYAMPSDLMAANTLFELECRILDDSKQAPPTSPPSGAEFESQTSCKQPLVLVAGPAVRAVSASDPADEERDREELAARGGADAGVEDLVVAENCREWIGPAPVVRQRSGYVEQAAGEDQHARPDAGMHPDGRQGKGGQRAKPDKRGADEKLWRVHPGKVDSSGGERQHPHHDQVCHSECAACGNEEDRSRRAGDKKEDHHMVQALKASIPGGSPPAAVIQRADAEQPDHAERVDSEGCPRRDSVPAGHQKRARDQRRPEPKHVQPSTQDRLWVVNTAPRIVKRVGWKRRRCIPVNGSHSAPT